MDGQAVASLWERWLAAAIDGLLFVLPSVPNLIRARNGRRRLPGSLDLLATFMSGAYQVSTTVLVGQTLGQRALGIRVVRRDTGGAPTISQVLLRWAITAVPDGLSLFRPIPDAENEIKEWLLRGGYRNTVMDEYVAYLVAHACGLKHALDEHEVDEELLDAAGGLVVALLRGGPAQDIDDYHDGVPVITSYIEHVRRCPMTIDRAGTVAEIRRWLTSPDADWRQRPVGAGRARFGSRSRTPARRSWIKPRRSSWSRMACEPGMTRCSRRRTTCWPHGNRHLRATCLASSGRSSSKRKLVSRVRQADEARMCCIVALAEATLPLAAVATGPADLLGLGPEFAVHGCIDFVLPVHGGLISHDRSQQCPPVGQVMARSA